MAQLNIRLDDDTREQFDTLANAKGLSTSELLRDLINDALGRSAPRRTRSSAAPMSLPAVERLRLAKLHELLAHVTADADEDGGGPDAVHNRHMAEVLLSGFTSEYEAVFYGVEPELSTQECSLLMDILDMFTMLERSYTELDEPGRASLGEQAEFALTFRGFDFQDPLETRLVSYADYLIRTDRWKALADRFDAAHEHGNSHLPMLAAYLRLLGAYRPVRKRQLEARGGYARFLLTAGELRQVIAAWAGNGSASAGHGPS